MKKSLLVSTGVLVAGALVGSKAFGEITFEQDGIRGDFGKLQLRGRFTAALQGAVFDPVEDPLADTQTDGNIDGSARLSLEYTTDNAWVLGVVADVDSGQEDIAGFERDEFYIFAASEYGRLEIGENDGPADTLSFHAPRVGMGQVRGDFARYTGTVALMTPYDSRDAAKVTYLSPPMRGLRLGLAYVPDFELNADDPDPARRQIQNDVFEFGAQFVRPVGGWSLGASGAYVVGEADPVSGREDISSWSAGLEARRGALTLGGAYVDRGKSNLLPTAEAETEWNGGISWEEDRWGLAASFAIGDENGGTVTRYGVGAEYFVTDNVFVRGDLVQYEEDFPETPSEDGIVGLIEIGVRF